MTSTTTDLIDGSKFNLLLFGLPILSFVSEAKEVATSTSIRHNQAIGREKNLFYFGITKVRQAELPHAVYTCVYCTAYCIFEVIILVPEVWFLQSNYFENPMLCIFSTTTCGN